MSDLRQLYQEVIVDHTRSPRNFGELAEATHCADGYNPLCGDQLKLFLKVDDQQRIVDIQFIGNGCSISTASASMMTEALKGKTIAEAEQIFHDFHQMVTQENTEPSDNLGKLAIFLGVRDYPSRVKCATLAWHTLEAAIHRQKDPASTE